MKLNNKKSGFTLAEVLVTLMIIGVIAAMTIPSLMQSTAQQEYKAAFKKAVSMLNQAVTLNYALDGEDASVSTGTDFFDILSKRLNIMSSTPNTQELYTADGMWFKVTAAAEGGSANPGACETGLGDTTTSCATVLVDVNGAKGPNKRTENSTRIYDIFTVAIYPQKALPANNILGEILYSK